MLDDRIETYIETVKGKCSVCSEVIYKTLGSSCAAYINGDRFHYPGSKDASCALTCKTCSSYINDTWVKAIGGSKENIKMRDKKLQCFLAELTVLSLKYKILINASPQLHFPYLDRKDFADGFYELYSDDNEFNWVYKVKD